MNRHSSNCNTQPGDSQIESTAPCTVMEDADMGPVVTVGCHVVYMYIRGLNFEKH